MNDLNPKRTADESLPEEGPSVDFRADTDVSVQIDRDKFVDEGTRADVATRPEVIGESEAAEVKSSIGLEAVLQALEISNSNEFIRDIRQRTLDTEDQKRQQKAQTLLAGEIFERVEVVLRAIDLDLGGAAEVSLLKQLRGTIGEVMQGIAPVLRSGVELSPGEAERIMQTAALLRKLLNQAFSQLSSAQHLTKPQRDLFSSLEDWLQQIGEPEAYIRRKPTRRSARKKAEEEPFALRVFKGIVNALRTLIVGAEEAVNEEEERIVSVVQPELEAPVPVDKPRTEETKEPMREDSEAMFVHVLRGRVTSGKKGAGVGGVSIFGGALGNQITDTLGNFVFTNVPHGFSFIIGPHKEGLKFSPPLVSGLALDSMVFEFAAVKE